MRHITGLITPARALHRVLVLELANTTTTAPKSNSSALLFSSPPALPLFTSHPTRIQSIRPRRLFSTTPAAHRAPAKGLPRNEEIPYRWVRVKDSEGVLSAAQPIRIALGNLPEGHNLVMVAPPAPTLSPGDVVTTTPTTPTTVIPPAAICVIENTLLKKQQAAEAREREKAEKIIERQTKTLELNWAIAAHDLSHKMKRLAEFLGKGLRVEILLAKKRGSRAATTDEQNALVQTIQDTALVGVPGTSEFKRQDGRVGGVLKMYFEGPRGNLKKGKKDKEKERERGNEKLNVDIEI